MLAEELVEGFAEQRLDRPALDSAEHAQLAVDGLGEVAGDGDAAGAAVPSLNFTIVGFFARSLKSFR